MRVETQGAVIRVLPRVGEVGRHHVLGVARVRHRCASGGGTRACSCSPRRCGSGTARYFAPTSGEADAGDPVAHKDLGERRLASPDAAKGTVHVELGPDQAVRVAGVARARRPACPSCRCRGASRRPQHGVHTRRLKKSDGLASTRASGARQRARAAGAQTPALMSLILKDTTVLFRSVS